MHARIASRLIALLTLAATMGGCAMLGSERYEDLAAELRRSTDRMERVAAGIVTSADASADLVVAVGEVATLARTAATSADQAAAQARAAAEVRQAGETVGAGVGGAIAGPAGAAAGQALGGQISDVVLGVVMLATALFGKGALDERKKRGQAEARAARAEAIAGKALA